MRPGTAAKPKIEAIDPLKFIASQKEFLIAGTIFIFVFMVVGVFKFSNLLAQITVKTAPPIPRIQGVKQLMASFVLIRTPLKVRNLCNKISLQIFNFGKQDMIYAHLSFAKIDDVDVGMEGTL